MIRIIDQYDLLPVADARTAMFRDCLLSRQAELAYLSHFVGCYRPSLQLACIQYYPIYILGDGKQRLGISFFGPQLPEKNLSAEPIIEITGLDESWLVLAPANPRGHESDLASFIFSGPADGFDSIFLFDYSSSTIQIIK